MESPATTPGSLDGGTEHDQQSARSPFRLLADERRRTLLAVLRARSSPIDEARLAERVAERDADPSRDAERNADRSVDVERVHATLHHVHLPALEAAGLVHRSEDGVVEPTGHGLWDDRAFDTLLASETLVTADETTTTLDVLASQDRRTMLDALREHGELSTGALAAAVSDVGDLEASELSLLHTHLPQLVDAGVVSVDEAEDRVRYQGNDVLEEWWFADHAPVQ